MQVKLDRYDTAYEYGSDPKVDRRIDSLNRLLNPEEGFGDGGGITFAATQTAEGTEGEPDAFLVVADSKPQEVKDEAIRIARSIEDATQTIMQ